jgi:hypothetical protein
VTTSRLELLPNHGTATSAIKALVPIVVGVGVYFTVARALRMQEAVTLLKRFRG